VLNQSEPPGYLRKLRPRLGYADLADQTMTHFRFTLKTILTLGLEKQIHACTQGLQKLCPCVQEINTFMDGGNSLGFLRK
jgi:hypothetical protein